MIRALRIALLGLIIVGLLIGTPAFALTLHLCTTKGELSLSAHECDRCAKPAHKSCCDGPKKPDSEARLQAPECCHGVTLEKGELTGLNIQTYKALSVVPLHLPLLFTSAPFSIIGATPVNASICDLPPPLADAGRHRYLRLSILLI